jgi:hypothetical protein
MKIHLQIPEDASPALGSRLTYAFRLFCAIYGHTPTLNSSRMAIADVTIGYRHSGIDERKTGAPTVWLDHGLDERDPRQPAPPPVKYARHGVITLLHYEPERNGCPDWLGEIFEWVSCADEYSLRACDCNRRTFFEQTYAGRYGIDAHIPYAALAMRGLQQEICRVVPRAEETPCAPDGSGGHVVIPIHVVNCLPLDRMRAITWLVRDAITSWVIAYRHAISLRQVFQAARIACGSARDPLDQLLKLAEEECRLGISSSYYFLARHAHRLDSGYALDSPDVVEAIRWLQVKGMEIGLHESAVRASLPLFDDVRALGLERSALEEQGIRVRGCQQHQLRFSLDRMIAAVENAGLEYDCSVGWPTHIGFRAGACFPFPPYDFTKEAPANFLEFPLIVMDQGLTGDGQQFHEVTQMIAASRRLGWGGISLLWHPAAFGTSWLPAHVGETYWRLAGERNRWNDSWMTASEFLEIARERFVQTGLLPASAPAFAPVELPIATSAGQRSSVERSVALAQKAVNA